MFTWMVNRAVEASGLIPEPVLELDDLVIAGNRDKLVEIFEKVTAEVEGYSIKAESLSLSELASHSWYFLKRAEDPWQYITRTGKYADIFGYAHLN